MEQDEDAPVFTVDYLTGSQEPVDYFTHDHPIPGDEEPTEQVKPCWDYLLRWQMHRVWRIYEIVEKILFYLENTDIYHVMEWLNNECCDLRVLRYYNGAVPGKPIPMAECTKAWLREGQYYLETTVIGSFTPMIADFYRHKWVLRRNALGDPISKEMLLSDCFNDDAWILGWVMPKFYRYNGAQANLPYRVGDPANFGLLDLPSMDDHNHPRCIECFRYLPMVHHFLTPASQVDSRRDRLDGYFRDCYIDDPTKSMCFDCLDDRWRLIDMFTAWGLLAKLLTPVFPLEGTLSPYGVFNHEIEEHATILPNVKDRSRRDRQRSKVMNREKEISPRTKIKGDARPCDNILLPKPLLRKMDEHTKVWTTLMLAAPKSMKGLPWDPAMSPLFKRKREVKKGEEADYEEEIIPSPGENPIPFIEPTVKKIDIHEPFLTDMWDYKLNGSRNHNHKPVMGFGLDNKNRRYWLHTILETIFHHPLIVPDEYANKMFSVFGHPDSLERRSKFPLHRKDALAKADMVMLRSNSAFRERLEQHLVPSNNMLKGFQLPFEPIQIGNHPNDTDVEDSPNNLWFGAMCCPSSMVRACWPCVADKRDPKDQRLGSDAGLYFLAHSCTQIALNCPVHNPIYTTREGELPEGYATEFETMNPYPHGGQRMWFFFEEDIRAAAEMFCEWLRGPERKENNIGAGRFLVRLQHYFGLRDFDEEKDRSKHPFWGRLKHFDPIGFKMRKGHLKCCIGQEFHDSPRPATEWPYVVRKRYGRATTMHTYAAVEANHTASASEVPCFDPLAELDPKQTVKNIFGLSVTHGKHEQVNCWGGTAFGTTHNKLSAMIENKRRFAAYREKDTLYNWFEKRQIVRMPPHDWDVFILDRRKARAEAKIRAEEKAKEEKAAKRKRAREAKKKDADYKPEEPKTKAKPKPKPRKQPAKKKPKSRTLKEIDDILTKKEEDLTAEFAAFTTAFADWLIEKDRSDQEIETMFNLWSKNAKVIRETFK